METHFLETAVVATSGAAASGGGEAVSTVSVGDDLVVRSCPVEVAAALAQYLLHGAVDAFGDGFALRPKGEVKV